MSEPEEVPLVVETPPGTDVSIAISLYSEDGRIICTKTVGEVNDLVTSPTGMYVYGLHDHTKKYVKHGQVADRPPNPTNIRDTTLFNIPMPSQIKIGRNTYDVTDSTMEISFPIPGTYKVTVLSFPEVDAEFEMVQT